MKLSKSTAATLSKNSLVATMATFIGEEAENIIDTSLLEEIGQYIEEVETTPSYVTALREVKLGNLAPFKYTNLIAARVVFENWKSSGSLAILRHPVLVSDQDELVGSRHSQSFVESVNREIKSFVSTIAEKAFERLSQKPKIFC